jgi:hypothetical protein
MYFPDDLYDFESEREYVSLALSGNLSIDDDSSLRFFSELPKAAEPRIKHQIDESLLAKKLRLKHKLFLSNQILPSDLPSAKFIKKHRQPVQPLKTDDLEKSWHIVEKDDLTPKIKTKQIKSPSKKTNTKRKIEEFMRESLKNMFKKQR